MTDSVLSNDIIHKAREQAALPSVDEWLRQGGQIEVLGDTPPSAWAPSPHGGMAAAIARQLRERMA